MTATRSCSGSIQITLLPAPRAAEALQQRQAQPVHAHVVVLEQGAGLLQRPRLTLLRATELALADVAVVVDRVRLAPQRALPLAGLRQEVPPRDGAVVLGGKV